ncbi:hypothetical protein [Aliivibrio fischeri]|uniref:hypothetical protein n=1 Tax=Aliivibrio fischeri TaxID=668 RepID=UPI0012D9F3BC|nr:hypothetical protein [Aliivibrio fischeri]MUK28461.1 hypothetical protein [Aliivibrio fischeri]MUK35960.1 hypothetical protein [Aliivibrio fischeri]
MKKNIERLKIALEEWLIRNNLDLDTEFYELNEWKKRDEDWLNDADLILIFEGGLHTILNYGGDTNEFDDYIASFGYFYEQGHSWNMGFYPIPGYNFEPTKGSYSYKLRDIRWQNKSRLVKEKARWRCQDCGSRERLETHHCYYTNMRLGNEPWEYPLSALRCLCHNCHQLRDKSESRMRAFLARLTTTQIDAIKENLDHAFYWFEEDAVIELLGQLGHCDNQIESHIPKLLLQRNKDT